ncbi:MAG: hypothetical protein L6U99_00720 [Clostridium sp.]|nr:MAG: hypothetical protein L6U99_00720 [Clostridium sp.]
MEVCGMKSKEFSKDCFYNALISLLDEEEFADIQISEICHKAGFNRSTFFIVIISQKNRYYYR